MENPVYRAEHERHAFWLAATRSKCGRSRRGYPAQDLRRPTRFPPPLLQGCFQLDLVLGIQLAHLPGVPLGLVPSSSPIMRSILPQLCSATSSSTRASAGIWSRISHKSISSEARRAQTGVRNSCAIVSTSVSMSTRLAARSKVKARHATYTAQVKLGATLLH